MKKIFIIGGIIIATVVVCFAAIAIFSSDQEVVEISGQESEPLVVVEVDEPEPILGYSPTYFKVISKVIQPTRLNWNFGIEGGTSLSQDEMTSASAVFMVDVSASTSFFRNHVSISEDLSAVTISATNLLGTLTGDIIATHVSISDDLTVAGELTVTATASFGDIVPNAHATYDLGTDANRWQELFVVSQSIHLGDIILSNIDGELVVEDRTGKKKLSDIGAFGATNEEGECIGLEEIESRVFVIEKDYMSKGKVFLYIVIAMIITFLLSLLVRRKDN